MLPYVKNYLIRTYLLIIAVPVAFIVIMSLATGSFVLAQPWGIGSTVGLTILATIAVARPMITAATNEAEQLVSLYDEQCDPPAFIEQGAAIAGRIVPPYDDWGAWYTSAFALAFADVGKTEYATRLVEGMRTSALAAKKPGARAGICLHMEPPIKRLLGIDLALEALSEAERNLEGSTDPVDADRLKFIAWERSLLTAERDGDDEKLVELLSHVSSTPSYPQRKRVEAAWEESQAQRRLGDAARERECLDYVIENGNKLSCVASARERLAELG